MFIHFLLNFPYHCFQFTFIDCFRKVRSRSNQRYNQQPNDDKLKLNCKYVSVWMGITFSCAWLFLLSYIVAVVHSEYHKMTKDVEKCE